MNGLLNGLKQANNYAVTENGMVVRKTTNSAIYDLFALGGSYRTRTDEEVIDLFRKAYAEDANLALKCLFYLRDVRGGQGERRFFRVAFKWLCENYAAAAKNNLWNISEYGRWDDLIYSTFGTEVQGDALDVISGVLLQDMLIDNPSLLAQWLPSENASSAVTKANAKIIRNHLGITSKEYRKVLSAIRKRLDVLETKMSDGNWDSIDFGKVPSVAGFRYSKAFLKREETRDRYKEFLANKNTKVNAGVLNPIDIVQRILSCWGGFETEEIDMLQKYWDNLKDYYNGREETGICVVDVSGSMSGTPMYAAVGMGAYIAERGKGPFKDHFITFSSNPELVEFEGNNIVEKFQNAKNANWGGSTDIEKTMDLILSTAIENNVKPEDMPTRLYIFSDMQFNQATKMSEEGGRVYFENLEKVWNKKGYTLPQIIFWNLDARNDNIPATGEKFSCVSGNSMVMIEGILSGKTGYDLMLDKLLSERYEKVNA